MRNWFMDEKLKLEGSWKKRYFFAKVLIYAIFSAGLFYGAYLILFPSASFTFSFRTPDASKNSIVEPRTDTNTLNKNGKVSSNETLIFDTNPIGDYSEAEIRFTLEKNSGNPQDGSVSVRRSYRSFFYPEGKEMSDVSNEELTKLVSNAESVFLVSRNKLWPIADAVTFQEMGWNWIDVQAVSGEDIGGLEKQKIFTVKTPHPDGTIFYDSAMEKYYLIDNGTKRAIGNVELIYPKFMMEPIIADSHGLEISEICQIEPSFKLLRRYKCTIPIEKMKGIAGNDFEFKTAFGNNVEIRDLNVTFKKTLNANNLRSALVTLKSRLINNYQ